MRFFSVEIDKYSPTALTCALERLYNMIPDYDYTWRIFINAGGIDYGIFLNFDIEEQTITISNQPSYNHGKDDLDAVIDAIINF